MFLIQEMMYLRYLRILILKMQHYMYLPPLLIFISRQNRGADSKAS